MQDVIVIGGGPAGSHVAARLAAAEYQVLVLEKSPYTGHKTACTGIVGLECVEKFHIAESAVLRRVNSARLFSPAGKELYLSRDGPQACVLDRVAFDKSMVAHATGAGAEYRFGHRATGLRTDGASVAVRVVSGDRKYDVTARVAVIAAGFSPGLVERLGLGGYRDFTIGAQAEVPAPSIEKVEVYFGDVAPGFFAWLVPAAPGVAKAGLMCRRRPGHYLKQWLAELKSAGKIMSDGEKIVYGGVPLRPLRRTFGERLLVVGDASGQVKPTSGGGIYYGLIGADVAADTLLRALAVGDLSARRLAAYERGWRRKLGGELRTGYRARRMFERLGNRRLDRLFDLVKAGGIDRALLAAPELSFDWHGRSIKSLFKYRAVAAAAGVFRFPFGEAGKR